MATAGQNHEHEHDQPQPQPLQHQHQRRAASTAAPSASMYESVLYKALANMYHPTANPTGAIVLSIAENALSKPAMADALATLPPVPPSDIGYSFNHGSRAARDAIAAFLERHHTHHRVDPEALVLASGVGALNDALASILCEPGDAVLTFAPGYRGYLQHFGNRAAVRVVAADLHDQPLPPHAVLTARTGSGAGLHDAATPAPAPLSICVHALQRAWERDGGDDSSRIRVVLVSSPHNPTGEVLSSDTVAAIVAWARQRRLHVIFDEVYANSVHDAGTVFRSVADVLHNELRDDVHVVWSVSKDLSLAGMRLAALLSHNESVVDAFKARFALFSSPSRLAQWAVAQLLADHEWTAKFIEDNAVRLRLAYEVCARHLRAMNVPFVPPAAGFFLVADLRAFMSAQTRDAELRLWKQICDAGVVMTPSHECLEMRAGFFRVCFGSVDVTTQEVAWTRVREVLQRQR